MNRRVRLKSTISTLHRIHYKIVTTSHGHETRASWSCTRYFLYLHLCPSYPHDRYEPKTARRPIPRPVIKPKPRSNHSQGDAHSTGLSGTSGDDALFLSSNDEGITTISDPARALPHVAESFPSIPHAGPSRPVLATPKTPRARRGKKAEAETEQSRREAYAQQLFDELNASVFGSGLPHVKLVWNKRLLTTAGRAKWHRSREGVDTTEIELAMKILDCDGSLSSQGESQGH